MVESTAKLREEIMALSGVDIMEVDGQTFKSTYAIMEELANKWQDLSDIQQASITELIAGKRQGNIVSALMTNFDIADNALKTSLDSSGSAMKEHEKWMQSLEAKLQQLQAAWQDLSQTFLSSDFLKFLLDGVINLVQGLEKLIDTMGVIPALFIAFGGYQLGKNGLMSMLFGKEFSLGSIGKLTSAFKGLFSVFARGGQVFAGSASLLYSFGGMSNVLKNLPALFKNSATGASTLAGSLLNTASASGGATGAFAKLLKAIPKHPYILAAATAVGVLGYAYFKAKKDAEELSEEVDKLTSEYQIQHKELIDNKSSFESMASKYAELSKGVDGLGRNVSLTADEYSEYQSVVNDIATQVPSLVSGYDSQGNAILSCKGNVEELTAAYEKLIHIQNNEILSNSGDIEKDFKNKLEDLDTYSFGDKGMTTSVAEGLEEMYNNKGKYTTRDDVFDYVQKNFKDKIGTFRKGVEYELEQAGIDTSDGVEAAIAETLKTNPDKIKSILDGFKAELDAAAEDAKTIAQATLSEAFDISGSDYAGMSDTMQNLVRQVVSGFDSEFYADLVTQGVNIEEYINGILDKFNSLSDSDNAEFEAALNLQTKFNNGDVSYGEYVSGLERAKSFIEGLNLDDEVEEQILLSLNVEEVTKDYNALKNRLTSDEYSIQMKTEEAEAFLDSLTASEYAVAVDLMMSGEVDLSGFDIESLRTYIKEQTKLQEALDFTIAMDVETESIEALNTAMAESVSGAGLSSEAIAALKVRYAELESQGYNLSAMFEETANGIHLNREAVAEFEQKLATDKLAETEGHLDVLKNRYDELTVEIDNCTDASERAALYREQQSIVDKINDLGTLASQYEGLASAYQKWQSIESAGSERDMYEGIIEGFENIEDELSRGWLDDGTIAFLELLTGKTNLASKSGEELKEIYDSLDDTIKNTNYSISDFFTVDEDGNSTNAGVYNFLDAIGQLEEEAFGGKDIVKRDEDGNIISFDFEVAGGDEAIAEALGISEELVQIMVRAADDAGFVVNLEGAYTQLADLKTEAEAARDTLISLKEKGFDKLKDIKLEDLNFNFEATGDDLVTEQEKAVELLDKFKKNGKVDLKMEGAQEALDIAEYLTIKLDDLTEPKFMQIDTSEVDEDLRDPIEKIQEIGDLCKQKHLVTLTGDTKELKEVQGEINKVAEEIEELDPEVKAQIGIDDSWDSKTIADKIEKGEIEIPAELELDVQMSDDLKDMRLMMMNQLGLASDNEVKLKIGYDIDDSIVDELTDEQKEVVVKYLAEHEEVDDYTPEQKEALVKYIADGGNLDSYTPEEKQAIVQYFADGGNVESYTPEEKQAIVEYLTDSGDPDSWTPEQKEAVAKFKKDSAEVDNYTPEDKKAIAKFIKDSAEPDNYQPPDKTQEVTANLDSSEPDNYQPKDRSFTVKAVLQKIGDWTNKLLSGGSTRQVVNGTANADGTAFVGGTTGRAFKHGDWSTKDSGTALVGELGRETLVRNGRYYTIGDTGAEFIHYEKGDIIFNHKQTEELFKNGKVTSGGGRGKALYRGTAFLEGTAFSGGSGGTGKTVIQADEVTVNTGSKGKGGVGKYSGDGSSAKDYGSEKASTSSSDSSSDSTADDFEETFDWIEVLITRVEEAMDRLDQKVNRTYKSWSSRNKNLDSELSLVEDAIAVQSSAYDAYMDEANSVGLSEEWKKKVRNGTVDISTVTDEDLADKIEEYQTWYEKAIECKDAVEDLKDKEAELYAQRFDNITTQYDDKIGRIDSKISRTEQDIEQADYTTSVSNLNGNNYREIIDQEENKITKLREKKSKLEDQLEKAVNDGVVTKYSEEWYRMRAEIDSTTEQIEESTTNISQAYRDMFDRIADKYDAIIGRINSKKTEIEQNIEQSRYTTSVNNINGDNYRKLITQEEKTISQLQKKKAEQEAALEEAVASGRIKKYSKEWYDMRAEIDATDSLIQQSTTNISEYYSDLFDRISDKYDAMLQEIEHTTAMLNEYIAQSEANGQIVSKKYYEELIKNEQKNIVKLKKQREELIAARDEAVASGAITVGSEEWYAMSAEIDATTQAIEESETAIINYGNSIRSIDWKVFDLIQERISNVTKEADFLIELMSHKKLFDDNGKMTAEGIATISLHGQNYNTHMYKADEYGKEIAKLDEEIAKDPYNQDLINRRQELLELQRESILAAEDEKEAMIDLVKEGIEIELDALQERIDKHNEELDSIKDLYDYQKKVKKQTEEIADLEKQMAAYSGDDSEEAQAKVQELRVSLEDAKEELEETEYEKYITDQKALLDSLYLEYETVLNQRLDNIDALLDGIITAVNAAASGEDSAITAALGEGGVIATILGGVYGEDGTFPTTLSTLTSATSAVGTTLSTEMKNIWNVGEGSAKSVIEKYGEGIVGDGETTLKSVLSGIKTGVNNMIKALDDGAEEDIENPDTQPSSDQEPQTEQPQTEQPTEKNLGEVTPDEKPTQQPKTPKTKQGNGKAEVGDKVKFKSGRYYYDSYGSNPSGYHNRGKNVYITKINKKGSHPYHISTGKKLGKGDLGWLKLKQLSGYFTGKKNIEKDEAAWTQEKGTEFIIRKSDGAILTPVAKNDSILNAAASNNIWNMANNPAEFIKDNLGLGVSNVPNNSNVQNTYTQTLENVVFNMPNVKNYDEMLSAMQKDKSFEKLVQAMTVDRIAGKSSLTKNKIK